ncbi:membrane peptidoglycan carboxypeptidase [Krasilnikovia cinnamomea]|uniref:Membrane peptidoglycan carboxypeptidase n=2 Tax=Krasilnikovia cinnamomea TaxID=349313 RepID=A0A4Q7ZR99_9ACTN|nr:membrane peptidoglycan carboxypeptidase [Krasilnikovia cinnamomea]
MRRLLKRATVVATVLTVGAGITVVGYVHSVQLPADPVEVQASTLYYRDGRTILARVGTQNHSDVALSAVPEEVQRAVLAAEDRDFYDHSGYSVRGILRAVVANLRGKRQGASTVTQQYVRNAFLTQDVSLDRKAKELALAIKLERKLTKDEILERYLNTIYYGRNAYGIAAAAHAYFGVTTDRLTAAQGAVLAAVIKDPFRYDPANDAAAAQQRWAWVVDAAQEKGWLGGVLEYPKVSQPSAAAAGPSGIVIDRVEQELAAHGVTSRMLHTQGLSIVTTLDAKAQAAGIAQVAKHLAGQPKDLRVALVAVDPRSGGVLAYYGGKQRGYFDDASAAHPAASTFKPIVLATALEAGISAQSLWDGSSPRLFPGRLGVPLYNHDDLQCPVCTLEESMIGSLNTPFYAVTEKLGADSVRKMAHSLGIPTAYGGTPALVDGKGDPKPGRTRPDIAIGRYAVTPADLATVYGTFAGAGVRHDRHFVESVTSPGGRRIWETRPRTRHVLDQAAAADVTSVLAAVVDKHAMTPDRPAAGKTGTQQWANTSDNQDAWMAGYTPELACAVWIGKADPGPIRDKRGKAIEGETLPAQLWTAFIREALRGRPVTPLPGPANVGRPAPFDIKPPTAETVPGEVPPKETRPRPEQLVPDARRKADLGRQDAGVTKQPRTAQ